MSDLSPSQNLDIGLKSLVNWTVAHFGQVVRRHLGDKAYQRIETLRSKMAKLREASQDETFNALKIELENLRDLSRDDRRDIALALR